MKKLIAIVLFALPTYSAAAPYFRPINVAKPVTVAGALIAEDTKQSEGTLMIPLLTHSTRDGCLLPSIVCEDWSPIAIGPSVNAGEWSLAIAPLFNVLPWMSAGAKMLIPDKYTSLRSMITPAAGEQQVTFSAGPTWLYKSSTNKGYYRTFVGLALHF